MFRNLLLHNKIFVVILLVACVLQLVSSCKGIDIINLASAKPVVVPLKAPRKVLHMITFVKEPWSGLCFAYMTRNDRGHPRTNTAGLAQVPCNVIKKDMGPLPTIPVYQYE
jgi:hypothetical protein